MLKRIGKFFKAHSLCPAGGIIIALYFVFGPATAESGWWDKGVDLLKNPAGTTVSQALTSEEIGLGLNMRVRLDNWVFFDTNIPLHQLTYFFLK